MIARAWYLLSAAWAPCCIAGGWGKDMEPGYYVMTYAPFAVPTVLGLAWRYITSVRFAGCRSIPARRR